MKTNNGNLLSGLALVTRFNVQIILAMLLAIQCGFGFDDMVFYSLVKFEILLLQ